MFSIISSCSFALFTTERVFSRYLLFSSSLFKISFQCFPVNQSDEMLFVTILSLFLAFRKHELHVLGSVVKVRRENRFIIVSNKFS